MSSLRHVWKGSHPHILERISCSLSCAWRNRATKQPQKLDSGGFRASSDAEPLSGNTVSLHSELAKTHKNTMTHYANYAYNAKKQHLCEIPSLQGLSRKPCAIHLRRRPFTLEQTDLCLTSSDCALTGKNHQIKVWPMAVSMHESHSIPIHSGSITNITNQARAKLERGRLSHVKSLGIPQNSSSSKVGNRHWGLWSLAVWPGAGTRHKSVKVISHTSSGIFSFFFKSCKSLHTVPAFVEYSPRAHYAKQCQGASGKDGSKGKAVPGGTCNVNFSSPK